MCLSSILLALATSSPGHAATIKGATEGFGVGVVLGEPTGLSLAVRPSIQTAFQAHLTWSVVHDHLRASLDWTPTISVIRPRSARVQFPFYVGIGGILAIDDDDGWVGARVPIGLAMHPAAVSLDVFAEIAPALYILPGTNPSFEGALGARYYF